VERRRDLIGKCRTALPDPQLDGRLGQGQFELFFSIRSRRCSALPVLPEDR
jgi:hypothetical protein